MSYPRDLDEYSIDELLDEISRRKALAQKQLCSYCGRKKNTTPCMFPTRHRGASL